MHKNLNDIANLENNSNIKNADEALSKEALVNSGLLSKNNRMLEAAADNATPNKGVTDNAPYSDIAEYKMINTDDSVEDYQGS